MSLDIARKVLEIEADAVRRMAERVDAQTQQAVEYLYTCQGRVVVTGMGKSGLVAQKISATLSSTGTPSFFLHPAEAIHGDLGKLARGDVLITLSYSGETNEILLLLDTVKRLGIPLISLTGNLDSTLSKASEVVIDVGIPQEACPLGLAPTASTTAQLAMGDALAMELLTLRGFKEDDFAQLHPGGNLAVQLRRVTQVMETGEKIPRVKPTDMLSDVIYEMSKKGMGVTTVIDDEGSLVGIVSDGDVRRFLQKRGTHALELTAAAIMSKKPVTIFEKELATKALNVMESFKITCLVVTDEEKHVKGIVHIHNLWTTQMF